ncbi:MAG: 2-amino-4-hydroxy-6-hydroxymethyldihydropteridine diphosphokinase [Caldilineae bacterium]|nr:MAG: 2-amino-4-hydroxy-6-hydroxymethyldihydropteridine diphosphokinase [Caldilineae bacterium]
MASVYLALGTNLGDRAQNLTEAIRRLGEVITVEKTSAIYETEPWGIEDQPAFYNQVLHGHTRLAPHALLRFAKEQELRMGRRPDAIRYGPRLIDIDILFYDRVCFASYSLTVPHPRLAERAFVLVPLADIAADLVHPGNGYTIEELVARLDTSGVRRI